MHLARVAVTTLATVCLSSPTWALDFTMDFEDIPPAVAPPAVPDQTFGSAVLGFYNGDPVYNRDGAQAWDTAFSADALAICAASASPDCKGNFPQAKSGVNAVGSVFSTSFSLELVPGLYISQMSFFYGAGGSGSEPAVQLYSGGQLLFTLGLDECSGTGFCGWQAFEVPQANLGANLITKVTFLGSENKVVYDDVFLSTSPIPEPATYGLMLLGLAMVAAIGRRRPR